MGLLDTLLGRSKPVRANLDALFSLPSAAVTLQVSAGLVTTGKAGVCFKPPAGQNFSEMQADIERLVSEPEGSSAPLDVHHVTDSYGYRWITLTGGTIDDLVTRVHMVHSSIEDAGWGTQLLCSAFGFTPAPDTGGTSGGQAEAPIAQAARPETADADGDSVTRPLYIVYLAKQGSFYPFAPMGHEARDSELELRIRSVVGEDLPVEADLSRWFPLWDLPIA